jgi:hypothetical protein
MRSVRRRSAATYRVYGEEEYLAGVDALAGRDLPPAGDLGHGRRLQRIAGAAALTGAVGTVGGVVGLAGLRMHTVDRREIAQRVVSPVRAAPARGQASTSAHMMRRRALHPIRIRRMHARRRMAVRRSRGSALRAQTAARTIAVSVPQTSAARYASPETHSGLRAQSEFGFER